jgi:hypothetical protein
MSIEATSAADPDPGDRIWPSVFGKTKKFEIIYLKRTYMKKNQALGEAFSLFVLSTHETLFFSF